MIFLKSLIFPVANCLYGFSIVFLVKCLLFCPRRELYIGSTKIPFTPGLLYRKRNYVINLMKNTLHNFLNDSRDNSSRSQVSIWENKVFRRVWDRLESIDNIKFLPHFITSNLRYGIALVAYELTRQFLRTFVPFLLEKYQVEHLIDIIEEKIDMEIIKEYYHRYVYKFMMIFFLSIGLLIGIGNMIVYLIIE